jgi:hypothetical protein
VRTTEMAFDAETVPSALTAASLPARFTTDTAVGPCLQNEPNFAPDDLEPQSAGTMA